jgi:hypothetical protein
MGCLFSLLTALICGCRTADEDLSVLKKLPLAVTEGIAPGSVHQTFLSDTADDWEPSLAVTREGVVHVSAVRRGPPRADGKLVLQTVVWTSQDRGATFAAPVTPDTAVESQGDARIQVDDKGIVRATWLGNDRDSTGKSVSASSGLVLATSRDRGRTFEVRTIAGEASGVADKPELVVSPDGRRLFIALEGVGGPLLFASEDAGKSWRNSRIVSTKTVHYWPSGFQLVSDSTLWIAVPSVPLWQQFARVATGSGTLHLMRSTDAGKIWVDDTVATIARSRKGCRHDPECLKVPSIKIASDSNGRVYVVYTQGKAREPYDLAFIVSENGGRTWSSPVALSRAPRAVTHDTADCDDPEIVAGGDGLVYVVWTDNREGPWNLYARRSLNAGKTWSGEIRLSRDDRAGFERFYGDYAGIGIDGRGTLHVAWGEGKGSIGRPGSKGGVWYARWDADS